MEEIIIILNRLTEEKVKLFWKTLFYISVSELLMCHILSFSFYNKW